MGSLSFVLARRQAKRQSVIQVVADAATEMRETLDRTVRAVLGVITTDAKKVFDRDLRESANAAKSELQRLESARRASEAERKQRIANLDPQIRQLREAIASAEREAERIEEKRRAPNPDRRP
jgi:predicted  nucleic acid-binding Zn-ribbon protein